MSDNMRAIIFSRASSTLASKVEGENICWTYMMVKCKNYKIKNLQDNKSLRGNVLVADEFRLIKLDIINSVLKQFLTNPRKPPFLEKPEYKDYPLESNMEIKRYVSI